MSQALYRKYRPKEWDEVMGQDHIVTTLKNAISADRVAHAYLFAGSRGTGKTTLARLLAKAVNCLNKDAKKRPDNDCEHCKAVNENRFLDLIEIDAASNTSVDDVRDLRDKINFSPSQGKYKIYIIDEVHMLSTAAFNALLKTLEEPPPHAIFVLATTEIHKIPATVLSRCQRHEFRRVPVDEIVTNLKKIVINFRLREIRSRWRLHKMYWALPPVKRCSTYSHRSTSTIPPAGSKPFTRRWMLELIRARWRGRSSSICAG
jgi:DNA polymerase-3 subunit gamma/tau